MDIVDGITANTSKGTVQQVLHCLLRTEVRDVLDAPAGRGALSAQLVKHGKTVTAIELDRKTFTVDDVPCIAADLDAQLPFEAASFDAVASVDGIEHLQNPFNLIREFHRVLRPGGRVVISTPNISAWRSRMRYLVTGFHNKGKLPLTEEAPNPLHHINLVSYPALRYMLVRYGFQIEAVEANRIKAAAWPYALLYPLVAAGTRFAFRKEKDLRQRELNREILRHLLSPAVALGETLIVSATKSR